jgi:hypothetical protein
MLLLAEADLHRIVADRDYLGRITDYLLVNSDGSLRDLSFRLAI